MATIKCRISQKNHRYAETPDGWAEKRIPTKPHEYIEIMLICRYVSCHFQIRVCAMSAVNWDDMKVVLAISRAGSITRAAEILQVDQSTAGRRLNAIEAALGAILFVRSKTGLLPTAAGEAAIARALEIELRVDRLGEQISNSSDGPVGSVRMLSSPWIFSRLASTSMAEFLQKNPGVDLRTISVSPKLHSRGDATVSLWFDAPVAEMEFPVKLGSIPYAVYVARDADAASSDWISFYDEDAPRLSPVRTMENLRRKGDRLRFTSTDASILLAATVSGAGKCLLPMCLAEGNPALVRLGDGPPELSRTLSMHLHPDTVQLVRVQAVVRWLRESFPSTFVPDGIACESA